MIFPLLLFWAPFVWLLSFLPPSLPQGLAGDEACAAWTLNLLGSAQNPLPILMGKVAFSLFPFGPPAFRLTVAGAVLVSSTVTRVLTSPESGSHVTRWSIERFR